MNQSGPPSRLKNSHQSPRHPRLTNSGSPRRQPKLAHHVRTTTQPDIKDLIVIEDTDCNQRNLNIVTTMATPPPGSFFEEGVAWTSDKTPTTNGTQAVAPKKKAHPEPLVKKFKQRQSLYEGQGLLKASMISSKKKAFPSILSPVGTTKVEIPGSDQSKKQPRKMLKVTKTMPLTSPNHNKGTFLPPPNSIVESSEDALASSSSFGLQILTGQRNGGLQSASHSANMKSSVVSRNSSTAKMNPKAPVLDSERSEYQAKYHYLSLKKKDNAIAIESRKHSSSPSRRKNQESEEGARIFRMSNPKNPDARGQNASPGSDRMRTYGFKKRVLDLKTGMPLQEKTTLSLEHQGQTSSTDIGPNKTIRNEHKAIGIKTYYFGSAQSPRSPRTHSPVQPGSPNQRGNSSQRNKQAVTPFKPAADEVPGFISPTFQSSEGMVPFVPSSLQKGAPSYTHLQEISPRGKKMFVMQKNDSKIGNNGVCTTTI